MKRPEIPSNANDSEIELRGKPVHPESCSEELRTYLQKLGGRIRLNMFQKHGRDHIIELVRIKNRFVFRVADPITKEVKLMEVESVSIARSEQHQRLAIEAMLLKKAWLMTVALLGMRKGLSDADLFVPDYVQFDTKRLKREISNLKEHFASSAKEMLLHYESSAFGKISTWLAQRYDEWHSSRRGVYCLGRVSEVEQAIGLLGKRRIFDCPPYAEVLLQGYYGTGIRHPEYHLATDLALLYNLFLDSEKLVVSSHPSAHARFPEHSLSLGRSVVLACFNLLEAFITGLASAFLYENPKVSRVIDRQLRGIGADGRYQNLRLDEKFEIFPRLITGKPALDMDRPPFRDLFGKHKAQRNALSHPSMPFDPDDKYRERNEAHLHDITLEGVNEIVDLTCQAICRVWKYVYDKPKPTWLWTRQSDGRFPNVDVKLTSNK